MSEDIKKAVKTVAATMENLSGDARRQYVATLEGMAIGAELAARKEPAHEKSE